MTIEKLKNELAALYGDRARVVISTDYESGQPYLTLIIAITEADNTVPKRVEIADAMLAKFHPFRGKAGVESLDYEFVVAREPTTDK